MPDGGAPGIELFPVDISEYEEWGPLDATSQVTALERLLKPFGAELAPWTEKAPRNVSAAMTRLGTWWRGEASVSVLYWVGHGWTDGEVAALVCAETPGDAGSDGVAPKALADAIVRRHRGRPEWTIVIVDACQTTGFIEAVAALAKAHPSYVAEVLLIGIADRAATDLGRLVAKLEKVIESDFGGEEIELWLMIPELRRGIGALAAEEVRMSRRPKLTRLQLPADGVTLENRAQVQAAFMALPGDTQRELVAMAHSSAIGEGAWHFQGREDAVERVLGWLIEGDHGMLVVTGGAGVGKSALLGHVVAVVQPAWRELFTRSGRMQPVDELRRPPDDVIRDVVRVTGRPTSHIVSDLGAVLGWSEPPVDATPLQRLETLCEAAARSDNRVVVVDALDEAEVPLAAARVLRTVAEAGARLIVGTRMSERDAPDTESEQEDLLIALGDGSSEVTTVHRLGPETESVCKLVRDRLTAAHPGRGEDPHFTAALELVLDTITAREMRFLLGSLLVTELLARPACFTADGVAELQELIDAASADGAHRRLFAKAVDRLSADDPAYRYVLEALAMSFGRGMPTRDNVLETSAGGLDPEPRGDAELDILAFQDAAAPYVSIDREDGETVYRLAHQTFREHFPPAPERHGLIAEALIEASLDDAPAGGYVARYLADHVAAGPAGLWDRLAARTELLDRLDPRTVAAAAQRSGLDGLPEAIVAVIAAQDLMVLSAPEDRPALRDLGRARAFGRRRFDRAAPGAPWSLRSAVVRVHPAHIVALRTHPAAAVACITRIDRGDGQTLIAAGCDDGTVRLWNPSRGVPYGPPLANGRRAVRALAAAIGSGSPVLVTGDEDGHVRLWDPLTGVPHEGEGFRLADGIRALSAWTTDGERRIAVATNAGRLAVYTGNGTLLGEPLLARGARALALVREDAGMRLVAGSDDDALRSWRLGKDGGLVFERRCALFNDWVETVDAFTTGGRVEIVAGAADRTVARWVPGAPAGAARSVPGPGGAVRAVAAVPHSDGIWIVAGAEDGAVRVFDGEHAKPIGQPLTGHDGAILGAATYTLDNAPRVVTGGEDGTLRVWDPAIAPHQPEPVERPRVLAVAALEDGDVVVTGDKTGALVLWNAADGRLIRSVVAHKGAVRAIATLADGRIVSAGDDATVRVWDVSLQERSGPPLTGHRETIRALAVHETPTGSWVVSGAFDGTVRRWRLDAPEPPVVTSRPGRVRALAILGDRLAVAGHDRELMFEATIGGAEIARARGPRDWVRTACALRGGQLATGDEGGMVRVWDGRTGAPITARRLHRGPVHAIVAGRAPGQVLSGGVDGTVRSWDIESGAVRTIRLGVAVNALHAVPRGVVVGTDEGHLVLDLA